MDWNKVKTRELDPPRQKTEPFAMMSLAWAAKAAAATNTAKAMVWIWLVQQVRKTRAEAVTVSNETLAKYGVSRKTKDAALRQLEAAGLITVERHSGKAPLVRLLP
jgi:Bacterial regulatory proteins, gntR family